MNPSNFFETVNGLTLKDLTIALDGRHFINCSFINCRFVYMGGQFELDDCRIEGGKLKPMGPLAMALGNEDPEKIKATILEAFENLRSKISGPSGVDADGTIRI